MHPGRNIRVIRISKDISQKELAVKVGITPTYLSMIENATKNPSLGLIEKLGKALGVPLALIFSDLQLTGA